MSLSARALSPSGGNCPREFEDKHKLGQFTSSQSNLNCGDFDAPSREKWAAAARTDSPSSSISNIVDMNVVVFIWSWMTAFRLLVISLRCSHSILIAGVS